NAVLKKMGREPFKFRSGMKNYVRLVDKPFRADQLYGGYPEEQKAVMRMAMRCQFCENPSCSPQNRYDIRGIMRRVAVGNFYGARKIANRMAADPGFSPAQCEKDCVLTGLNQKSVQIQKVTEYLLSTALLE
ncbi:MAG: FAD-dependent oxidoreductase, partial [Eubacteriales bacterium]